MPTNRGFQTIMGVGLQNAWATAAAVSARIPYVSDSLEHQFNPIMNAALVGNAARGKSQQGAEVSGGSFTARLTYDVQQPVLEQFFGTFTDETDPTEDHYDYDATVDDSGLTIAINRIVSIHEYIGFKTSTFTLQGSAGEAVTYTCEGMAKDRLISGTTNNAAALTALGDEAGHVVYHEMSLWIGDLANDLTSGDAFSPSQFSLTLNRNLQADEVNSQTLLEALENDFASGQLTFTLPRYDSNQFITWHEAHTSLQAILSFTDGSSTIAIHMPKLCVVTNPVQQAGAGLAQLPITLDLYNNDDAANTSTDMTFTQHVRIFES